MPEFTIRFLTNEQKRIIELRNKKTKRKIPKERRSENRITGREVTKKEIEEAVSVDLINAEDKNLTENERAIRFFEKMHPFTNTISWGPKKDY